MKLTIDNILHGIEDGNGKIKIHTRDLDGEIIFSMLEVEFYVE